jgi:hypothetical protein
MIFKPGFQDGTFLLFLFFAMLPSASLGDGNVTPDRTGKWRM